jgi:adenylate kinase family enzyme
MKSAGIRVPDDLKRIAVIGTSCSGKSTFSRRIADVLRQSHIELDALHWGPDWTPRPTEEFKSDVTQAVVEKCWVVDGNYSKVRDTVLQRATTLIWLNYGFVTVFRRALLRTIRRTVCAEELFSGNRETFVKSFFSKESILWWVITTFRRRRKEYQQIRESAQYPQLAWLEFRHPAEAEQFLAGLSSDSGDIS